MGTSPHVHHGLLKGWGVDVGGGVNEPGPRPHGELGGACGDGAIIGAPFQVEFHLVSSIGASGGGGAKPAGGNSQGI